MNFFYADGSPVVIRNSTRSVVDRVMESQHVDLVAQQERIEAFSYWARGTLQGFADVINCVNSDERRFLLEGLKDRLAHSIKQFEGWLFMFLTRENAYLDPKSEACATLLGMYGRVDGLRDQMNDRNSLVSTWRELSDLIFEASKCLIDCLTAGNNGRARHDLLIPILKAGSKVVDGESPVGTQSKIHETLSPSITSFDITIARVLTEIEYILDEAERARGENKNAHSGEE